MPFTAHPPSRRRQQARSGRPVGSDSAAREPTGATATRPEGTSATSTAEVSGPVRLGTPHVAGPRGPAPPLLRGPPPRRCPPAPPSRGHRRGCSKLHARRKRSKDQNVAQTAASARDGPPTARKGVCRCTTRLPDRDRWQRAYATVLSGPF